MNALRPTDTSEPLGPVVVSDTDHQWQEVDVAQPACGPLRQAAGAAGGNGDAAQPATCKPTVSVPQKPFWPGLPALQLVLTATLPSQSQALVA